MFQPKDVVRFAIIVVVAYTGLTLSWSTLDRAYASWFRSTGNIVFSQFWLWSEAKVQFVDLHADDMRAQVNAKLPGSLPTNFKLPKHDGVQDTLLMLRNKNTPADVGFLRTSSRILGYTPLAILIALVLATPTKWIRKLWMMLWGMLLVHLFIAVRISVILLQDGYAADKAYALFHPGPFMQDVFDRGKTILADNPTFSYLASVFLWLMVWIGLEIWSSMGKKKTRE